MTDVNHIDDTLDLNRRAQCHAALSDVGRLAIVDELRRSDRTPSDLGRLIGVSSNLLAHHLDLLESAGLIGRSKSTGDGRRRYVYLIHDSLALFVRPSPVVAQPALFVCTQNSARSQLAAALWTSLTGEPSQSAGTKPAKRVHRLAISAARRVGLTIEDTPPRHLDTIEPRPRLVITVCDEVHEELSTPENWLHWSVPDPVADRRPAAFDASLRNLRERMIALIGPVAA